MSDSVVLKCPQCGEDQSLPEDERDPVEPDYSLNPCDVCTLENLEALDNDEL